MNLICFTRTWAALFDQLRKLSVAAAYWLRVYARGWKIYTCRYATERSSVLPLQEARSNQDTYVASRPHRSANATQFHLLCHCSNIPAVCNRRLSKGDTFVAVAQFALRHFLQMSRKTQA
jgi:hypothetical protein